MLCPKFISKAFAEEIWINKKCIIKRTDLSNEIMMIRNVDIKVRNIGENPVNTHINCPKMPKQNSSIFYIVSYQKSNIIFTVYLTVYKMPILLSI